MNNFLVAELCDNDFGYTIRDAIQDGVEYWGLTNQFPAEKWKHFILNYLENYQKQRNLIDSREEQGLYTINHTLVYLTERLKVSYQTHAPTADHDGGSAGYDFNRKYLFTY